MELRRPHPSADFDESLALMQAYDRSVDLERGVWLAVNEGRIAGVMHVHERRA